MLVLSLFPGVDLLGLAFEQEGFTVVQGPDVIFGRDIRNFHPPAGRFDGVIGGPPCQAFSSLRYLVEHNGHRVAENLIPEFERVVAEVEPGWFVMENVPGAPRPLVPGYGICDRLVEDVAVGGSTKRTRRISFGLRGYANLIAQMRFHVQTAALWRTDPAPAVLARSGGRRRPVAIGGSGKPEKDYSGGEIARRRSGSEGLRLVLRDQGLPADFLTDAPFTAEGKFRVVGNGVPIPMGRAIAKAVVAAIEGRR